MDKLIINHFLKISEKIKIKSHGRVSYQNDEEPNWSDVMQTGRQCRIYGLYTDAIWCYDLATNMTNYLDIDLEKKKELKSYVLSAKAMCLSTMGNHTEAITECEEALLLFHENHEAYCNKGIALNNLGKYKESIAAHKKAVEINPEFSNSWNAIGQIMVDQEKDYHNAIPYLDKAIELSKGQDNNAWINKGNALSYLGKLEEAFFCWDTAYEIEPENNVHAMLNKAIWLFKGQKKKNESLNLLNKVKDNISIDNPFYNQITQLYNQILNDH